jgi:formamidopyrimidine-DNA glycosylase
MSTQITSNRWGIDAHDDISGQTRVAADPTAQRAQDSMAQLVRMGQDTSLRSLQVWADLARKFGTTAPDPAVGATMCSLAHDPFEKLLVAQRQIVNELVATQRQITQQLVDAAAVVDDHPACR